MVEMKLTDGNNADGNTPPAPVDPTINAEAAQIAAMHSDAKREFQAMMAQQSAAATPDKPEPVSPSANPQETPAPAEPTADKAGIKDDVPKQFQDKDGSLDENKILKSTQNQEQLNAKKRELLDKYKALQREGSQLDKSIKEVKPKEEPPQANPLPLDPFVSGELTQEERKALEEAKNEPLVSALLKAQAALAKVATDDIRRDTEASKMQSREISMLQRLDELAKEGNDWLYTDEGQTQVDQFLRDPRNQALWKTDDPYGYAVARLAKQFVSQGTPNGQARPAGTPMLGTGRAIPPSVSETVSPAQELEKLRGSLESGIGDRSELRKVENELRRKASQIFR